MGLRILRQKPPDGGRIVRHGSYGGRGSSGGGGSGDDEDDDSFALLLSW